MVVHDIHRFSDEIQRRKEDEDGRDQFRGPAIEE